MDDKCIFCPFRFLQDFQSQKKKEVREQKQVTLDSLPTERFTERFEHFNIEKSSHIPLHGENHSVEPYAIQMLDK